MSLFKTQKKLLVLFLSLVLLVIGSIQLFIPSENTIEPINTIVEWSEEEIGDTRNSLLAVWAITRVVNAGISLLQEKEISLIAISGKPFKVLEPLDDSIERMSEMLFYLAVFSTILSFVFEPMVTLGFIICGAGLLGIWIRGKFNQFGNLTWPIHLAVIGGYLMSFPILFFFSMQLFHLATDHRIENAHKKFNSLTQVSELEESEISNNTNLDVPTNDEDGWFSSILNFNLIPESVSLIADHAKTYFTSSIDLMQRMLNIVGNTESIIETGIVLMSLYFLKIVVFPLIVMFGNFLLFRYLYKRNMRPLMSNAKSTVENLLA